jgi:LysR family transcriptional regulator, nitrogen assimilation regulatory protein
MDFRRLGYFAQVAELGSLSKTSDRIGIAQPSLSRQMRLLEEELGVTLFTRGARGMQLTDAGEMLYKRVAGPLRDIGHALYEVRSLPTDAGGEVAFGMPPTIVQMLAGALARRIATYAPNISLRIVDAYTGHLLEWIERGELDGAILYGPTPAGLNATKLLEDELMLVGPPQSPIASEGAVDFRRLGELPLILPSPSHGLRILLETAAAKARTKLNVHVQADSYQLMKELVETGLGYTALPHCAFSRDVALGRLTFARVRNPAVTRQLFLALKPLSERPRALLEVENFVRQEVASLVQQGAWTAARLFAIGDT